MRRTTGILLGAAGALVLVPVILVALVLLAANTDWGRLLIEGAATQLSGGQVVLKGLSGRFPYDLRIARIELREAGAPWLDASDVTLQWSPSQLTRRLLRIERLHAARVELASLPVGPARRDAASGPFELPIRLDIAEVGIDELELGPSLAGRPASVRLRGNVRAASLQEAEGELRVTRLDSAGDYRLSGHIDSVSVALDLDANEPAQGLVAGLANLPNLGALAIRARIDGPRQSTAARLSVAAGPMRASGDGTLDLVGRVVDLDVLVEAPAMTPREDLSWRRVSLQAHAHGSFERPDATGRLHIQELRAGDVQARDLSADVEGSRGRLEAHAVLDRLRIPGSNPDLLSAAPVDLRAELRLDDPRRPMTFALSHPLLSARGHADIGDRIVGTVTIDATALAPFAAIADLDLQGRARLDATFAADRDAANVEIDGVANVTGGASPLRSLVGNNARIAASARWQGRDLSIARLALDGRGLRLSARGTIGSDATDANWQLSLSDLSMIDSTLAGRLEVQGRIEGPQDKLRLTADATGDAGFAAGPRGPVMASARLEGLPGTPAGTFDLHATLAGAPLDVATKLRWNPDGALVATIERVDWRSAHADGTVAFAARDRRPQGRIAARIEHLSDLGPWIGRDLAGTATAQADFGERGERTVATIEVDVRNGAVGGGRIGHLGVSGRIENPASRPSLALRVDAEDIVANRAAGSARATVDGTLDALVLEASADLVADAPAHLAATATLNVPARAVTLSALKIRYRDETAQLLAPARISLGEELAVDRLRVGMQQAVLEVAGRISPTLDLTGSVHGVNLALARTLVPSLRADGTISVDARLTGTTAQPSGTIRLTGSGLRLREGAGPALPSASLQANASLDGASARVDARLAGGSRVRLDAIGTVPLSMAAPIDVRIEGTIDATILNPVLEVNGRRVQGQASLDVAVSGTLAAPRIDGSATLARGEIQDYTLGAQLTGVEALLQAAGDTVRIASFTARAGSGTVSASGTVGLLAAGRPVDIRLTAHNARTFASDLLSADTDLDLALRGNAGSRLDLTGRITVNRADVNVPNALPPTVAVLDVRRPGQKTPPPPTRATIIGLDVDVDAPQRIFVRGRGLDAEAGGRLHVAGTTATPQVSGGFDLRRGTFDLGGASLRFTSGRVSFNGTGLSQKIDPTLDFLAETTSAGITARLAVTGFADAPRIALTSVPEMSQDEILSRLLFGTSMRQLTPVQVVQIATALVSITGAGGGFNPLLAAQRSLGLDRLSVGSTATGATTVEAGRYVYENVYVGAKQTTSGGTQAKVQVDLTKHLKIQATLGTGATTAQGVTPDNDPGSSIGLIYQFEY